MLDINALPASQPIEIPVSKGKYNALVNQEHSDFIKQFSWSAVHTKYRTYAIRSEKANNKKKIKLSHEIFNLVFGRYPVKGESVRFKVGNGLDCTLDNLIFKRLE